MNEIIKEIKKQYGDYEIVKTIFIPTHIDIIIRNNLFYIKKDDIKYIKEIKNKYEKKETIKQFVKNKFKL
jgi:hypothetical protein